MAGFYFFMAPPLLGGTALAPVLQFGMRAFGMTLGQRLCVQLGLVGYPIYYSYYGSEDLLQGHAGNGFQGTKWNKYFALATMFTTGVFGLGWGVLINGFALLSRT